jgi:hypothetical protein
MVYFSSGLAGAMGYLTFKFMNKTQLALLNVAASCLAILCYHGSFIEFQRVKSCENNIRGNINNSVEGHNASDVYSQLSLIDHSDILTEPQISGDTV